MNQIVLLYKLYKASWRLIQARCYFAFYLRIFQNPRKSQENYEHVFVPARLLRVISNGSWKCNIFFVTLAEQNKYANQHIINQLANKYATPAIYSWHDERITLLLVLVNENLVSLVCLLGRYCLFLKHYEGDCYLKKVIFLKIIIVPNINIVTSIC